MTASATAAGPDVLARAPGKLYIAGEYAVVEPGHPAVLIAVDRVITVRLTAAAGCGRVRSSRWGHSPVTWVRGADEQIVLDHSPLDYVTSAIALMERLRAERGLAPRYFDLAIDSELDDPSGRKFGLGSSGAVTAAVVDAVGRFYSMGLRPQDRFRLALLATIAIAPRASGGDVAASTYGGWIEYTAPDRAALRARAAASTVTAMLTAPEWEVSRIRRLGDPAGLALLVGWTGRPASTEHLVARVHRDATDVDARYADFLTGSRRAVEELTAAWTTDPVTVLGRIRTCRSMLQELGALRGTVIETPQLQLLCDLAEAHGAAGKPSGAGGGDCGIVLLPDTADPAALLESWREHDILPLMLRAHSPAAAPTAPDQAGDTHD
ncbi:phosphomevalonate kinase [Brevibacterium salitolerans]|uniref:phosphomevalonate kinase n=1 Tax=Brevibacterium salitolerans TaxID=1403566 RepID=A0ABP5IWA5_9MICO